MSQEAYIVAAKRSPVGKAPRGTLRFYRPDDLAAQVIRAVLAEVPQLDPQRIDDVLVGNAMPEAEQGLNVGRLIALLGLDTVEVPGVTVNRYCASGLETIAMAVAKIRSGMADCLLAGGAESMSYIPMGGWKVSPNYAVAQTHPDWYNNMGLTAEAVAQQYSVSREDQDAFALESHRKALNALAENRFAEHTVPLEVAQVVLNEKNKRITQTRTFAQDEGPRADTTPEALARLKPVFAAKGSVTAGNSSQTSDGAAFVLVMSERMVNELGLKPIARLVSYAAAGVEPRIMGIGPVAAVPKALRQAQLRLGQIDRIELNEAFASQSLAVIRELDLDPAKVNPNGGAIALGHPLGCTGAKLSVQLFSELRRTQSRYGLVTMCVGTGQGAAGIFERLD
ncbi:acetyl-CoA C-acyltransferase [bacterium]|nr:acetyl-CoA C-acyltransferase [bacterium]